MCKKSKATLNLSNEICPPENNFCTHIYINWFQTDIQNKLYFNVYDWFLFQVLLNISPSYQDLHLFDFAHLIIVKKHWLPQNEDKGLLVI